MCSRLTSLAIPGSLRSFSACFGVLRRSATHDARAHTPIAGLCVFCEGRPSVGAFASEVKRTAGSHEDAKAPRFGGRKTWSKLFLYGNQIFTYRPELSGSDRIEVLECNSHSPVYLPKRACNMVTPSLLLLYSPGHVVLRGFFMVSRQASAPAPRALRLHLVC